MCHIETPRSISYRDDCRSGLHGTGGLVRADPLHVGSNGNYSYELILGEIANLMGDYRIVVSHGSREAEISVTLQDNSVIICTNYTIPGAGMPSERQKQIWNKVEDAAGKHADNNSGNIIFTNEVIYASAVR